MSTQVATTLETTLRASETVADATRAFHFARPAGFDFRAGQAIELLLPDPGGAPQDLGHAFSIVSAPHEDRITVATRMRDSAYKRALKALAPGARARIDGPFGSLTLHKSRARGALFVAGGIGITPFMSMLRHAAREGFAQPVTLLYSNRRPEDAAFLEELRAIERGHQSFTLVATMTGMSKSSRKWDGPTQMVDAEMAAQALRALASPISYVAGPPAMVQAMRAILVEAGADEDDIRTEDFAGY